MKKLTLICFIVVITAGWGSKKKKYDPTTLVFPPYLHTLGIRKATKYHLFIFTQNKVKFRDPQALATVRLDSWENPNDKGDDDEVTVYGVNSGQNNIIYNKSMTSLGVYGLNEKGKRKLKSPRGIAANSRGDVYVADTGNNRIVRLFNPKSNLQFVKGIGKYGIKQGEFNRPRDVFLDSQGNVYVTDTGNNRVQVFDKNDNFKFSFGTSGKENGELFLPDAIVVNDKRERWAYYRKEFIMIIDLNNSRIQKFDIQGNFIKSINAEDFGYPDVYLSYMALDYYCNIYVTDKVNNCIHKFDRNLNYLTSYGRKGKGDKEFIEPRGITIYRRFGQMFVAEKEGAQYYWIGTDFKDFTVHLYQQRKCFFTFEYFLTETSFITVDVFSEDEKFVTRIWNKRFKSSGRQSDNWRCNVRNWPDSVLLKDNLTIAPRYKNIKNLPRGNYKIRYKFEPTYSSYRHFYKETTEHVKIE